MIPDIHAIVEMLLAGECTAQQAIGWINIHMENTELRDCFAGYAMQSLLTAAMQQSGDDVRAVPKVAYDVADAMLKARAK